MKIIYSLISFALYGLAFCVFLICALFLYIISFINTYLFYKSIKFCCRIILASFCAFPCINGTFPKKGTYIIMMNHTSFLDIFLFPLIPSGLWTGITAIENFNYPILSTLLKKLNAIPIERKNKNSAIRSIQYAEAVIRQGFHIGILPEGSRTLNGKMLPLKKGGFHMAINTNTAIIPVGTKGAFSFKPKNRWWLRPGKIEINIGKPIFIEQENNQDIDSLMRIVEKQIEFLNEN